ncbi:MAG: calcium-binding protein, partial [Betaproteobacteria bacterium]|nr:calcium-binding protein [Betaproteobacteria bacterium]
DVIYGGGGKDSILAGDGNDTIKGSLGDDTINGGGGDDVITGGEPGYYNPEGFYDGSKPFEGNKVIDGGLGNDTINGGVGDDILLGGEGNDVIDGKQNSDSIDGGSGSDILVGGTGNDTIRGGAGNDLIKGGNDFLRNFQGGAYLSTSPGSPNYEGDKLLDGGDGEDTVFGGSGRDTLLGGTGNDSLLGLESNDSLDGGAGNDTLIGGVGDEGEDSTTDALQNVEVIKIGNVANLVGSLAVVQSTVSALQGAGSLPSDFNAIISDAAGATLAASALSALGGKTTGVVTVSNAVVISGKAAEVTAALVTADTLVQAGSAKVTITDTISVSAVNAIASKTSGVITATITEGG